MALVLTAAELAALKTVFLVEATGLQAQIDFLTLRKTLFDDLGTAYVKMRDETEQDLRDSIEAQRVELQDADPGPRVHFIVFGAAFPPAGIDPTDWKIYASTIHDVDSQEVGFEDTRFNEVDFTPLTPMNGETLVWVLAGGSDNEGKEFTVSTTVGTVVHLASSTGIDIQTTWTYYIKEDIDIDLSTEIENGGTTADADILKFQPRWTEMDQGSKDSFYGSTALSDAADSARTNQQPRKDFATERDTMLTEKGISP